MTKGHDLAQGWRLDRIPGKRVRRLADDRGLALPLWIVCDGEHHADAHLRMSLTEAEQLHAELCLALGDDGPRQTLACRQD
ncbi:hypothetical protein GCM10020367_29350 [Streptomyces sannanensis]|uniref:Uncharacterized protein n=1 Tax=Streptomyces sannanensis TaxID=285536 RepID=A0ABP6SC14_9ACTN